MPLTPHLPAGPRRPEIRVAATYALVAGLWVLASDRVLGLLVADPERMTRLAVIKGWVFVAVTSALLYGLVRRTFSTMRKSDEALQEALRLQASILDNSAVGIAFVEARSFRWINATLLQILGQTQEALLHQPTRLIYPSEEEYARFGERAYAALAASGKAIFEQQLRRGDGAIIWCQLEARLLDPVNPEAGSVWLCRDISAQVRAEQELGRVHRIQSLILDNSTVAIAFVRQRTFEWVNRRMPELFGLPAEALQSAPTRIIFPDLESYEDFGRDAYPRLARGEKAEAELPMRRGDGSLFWCRIEGRALDPAAPDSGSIWIWEDVSARREAQEELARVHRIQSLILDNSTVGIAFVRHRAFEWVNPRLAEMLGRSVPELTGASTRLIYPSDEVFETTGRQAYAKLPKGAWFEFELEPERPDGGRVPVHILGKALDPTQAQEGSVWIFEDITARKRSEEALRRIRTQENLGLFARDVAQTFGRLMARLLDHVGHARSAPTASVLPPLLEDTTRAAQEGSDLSRRLLAYSGLAPMRTEPLDLRTLVQDTAHGLKASLGRVELALDLAQGLPPIEGDPALLQQALRELVANALEAIGDGPGRLSLTACLEAPGVCLEVEDTGPGMPPEVQAHIFDPFFTTKPQHHGLGLPAALGILRAHQAELHVASEAGRGSRVSVRFPAKAAAPPEASAELPGDTTGAILLADDEPVIREIASLTLERMGHRVFQAEDGLDAMACFESHMGEIRLVLLDFGMPRMDGKEVLRRLKALAPELPVILCSGYGEQDLQGEFPEGGPTAYLQKPYRPAELRRLVQDVLHP